MLDNLGSKTEVAGYIRVSTLEQARGGESLHVQQESIQRYASAHGYVLVNIYRDEGFSGASLTRPGLNSLREDAKNRKFKKVIFNNLSRFGRNTRDLMNLYEEFENDYKVSLISINEGINTDTPAGRLLKTVLSAIAEFERDTISIRTQECKFSRLKKFETFVGMTPYGYKFDKNKRTMMVVPKEKKVVLKIVDLYINKDMPLRPIALHLNRYKYRTRRGAKWCASTIGLMLKNSAYAGYKYVNTHEYFMRGKKSVIKRINVRGRYSRVYKPKSLWVKYPFPKIIDQETYRQIRRKAWHGRFRRKSFVVDDNFLAQGLMKCSLCGGKVNCVNCSLRGKYPRRTYYKCYWAGGSKALRKDHGKEHCLLPTVRMRYVDDFVWSMVSSAILNPEKIFLKFLDSELVQGKLVENKTELELNIDHIENEITGIIELTSKVPDGLIKIKAMKKIDHLLLEEVVLKNELDPIQRKLDTISSGRAAISKLKCVEQRSVISKCLASLPGKEKKKIVKMLLGFEDQGRFPVTVRVEEIDGIVDKIKKTKRKDELENYCYVDVDFNLRLEKVVDIVQYLVEMNRLPKQKYFEGIDPESLRSFLVPVSESTSVPCLNPKPSLKLWVNV